MPNPPNTTSRPARLLVAVGIVALGDYVLLLRGWSHPPPTAPETFDPVAPTTAEPARLELSRQLSPPGLGTPPPAAAPPPRRGWLTPLIAFVLPLGLGFILAAWANRRRADESALARAEHQPLDADATGSARAGAASPAASEHPEDADARPSGQDGAPDTAPPEDSIGPPQEEDESAEWQDLPVDALHERLHAKNQVIATLETIVRENRDEWEDRERESADQRTRIAELERELEAVSHVVDQGAPLPTDTTGDEAPLRPEILTRIEKEDRDAAQSSPGQAV